MYPCSLCHIELSSLISLNEHYQGKKHLKKKQLESKINNKNYGVFVFKLRPIHNSNALHKFFEKFGSIKEINFKEDKNSYALVYFNNENSVQHVLKKNHYMICGGIVGVKPAIHPKVYPYNKAEESCGPVIKRLEAVRAEMSSQKNIYDQFEIMMGRLELSSEDLRNMRADIYRLERELQYYLPDCRLVIYGSSVSGLATIGCDADIFLDISQVDGKRCKQIKGISFADINEAVQQQQNKSNQQKAIKKVLREMTWLLRYRIPFIKNVQPILTARCPIIKFMQKSIHVDINMTNRLGIINSDLLRLYIDRDQRVRHYLYAVRIFAKVKNIAGNAPLGQFSSYCFTMLAIFVLQILPEPVIPTLYFLRRIAEPHEHLMIDGWDVTYSRNLKAVPLSCNKLNIDGLFYEFCKFCLSFNFNANVISLKAAKVIPREEFSEILEVDEEIQSFKILKEVCIQDTFDLSHNIAASVTSESLMKLKEECNSAMTLMNSEKWHSPKDDGQHWGLSLLLEVNDS